MEFYRTCHLYHHGKLFYFLLNGGSDGGRKGRSGCDDRDDGGRYGTADAPTAGEAGHLFLFLFFSLPPLSAQL